jgi:hypothetical protein
MLWDGFGVVEELVKLGLGFGADFFELLPGEIACIFIRGFEALE